MNNNMMILTGFLFFVGVARILRGLFREKHADTANTGADLSGGVKKSHIRWKAYKHTGYVYLGVAVVLLFLAIFSDINISDNAVLPIIMGCFFLSFVFIESKSK